MSFSGPDFSTLGVSMLDKGVPAEALDYLTHRGHTRKSIAAANFRFLDHEDRIVGLFPASRRGTHHGGVTLADPKSKACWWPLWAIILPYPDDATYAVARLEYRVAELGKEKEPPKFLTPTGRGLLPYVPPGIPRKHLLDVRKPLYLIESPFKSIVAASHGITCIGVNGCHGAQERQTALPTDATAEQARAVIRPELHEYLMPGREVCMLTDADARTNLNVRRALLVAMDAVEIGFGCKAVYVPLPDLGDGKTGIDDYFAAGHTVKEFDKLPRHARESREVGLLRCALMDRTQLGLAQRFVAMHGDDCRHDPKPGTWYTYTAKGYRCGDVEPHRRMVAVVQSLPAELAAAHGEAEIKQRKKFQDDCGRSGTINGALEMAAKSRALEIDSALFDAEQDLIGVRNGVLRLSNGKLLKASRTLMVTKSMACAYDPKAKAPLWAGFISRICSGQRDLIAYLQEIAGACLAGRSARQEIFFLYGEGSNGKSVYIETLTRLLDEYAVTIPARVLLKAQRSGDPEKATPFLITLHGKRLATCSELSESTPIDEATIKDLNGGDLISARANYGSSFQFRNTARMLVRCNHLPVVNGTDKAVWDRIRAVPFTATIPEHEQDPDFAVKIAAAELPGILTWAYAGFKRFAARGHRFETPHAVQELTNKHRVESDVIGSWIEECVEIDKSKSEPPYRESQAEVTKCYTDWAHANNHMPMSAKNLWAKLRERLGFDPIARGVGGVKYARGLRLIRNPVADNLIKYQNDEIARLERELAALKGEGGDRTASTSSGKKVFSVIKGGRG